MLIAPSTSRFAIGYRILKKSYLGSFPYLTLLLSVISLWMTANKSVAQSVDESGVPTKLIYDESNESWTLSWLQPAEKLNIRIRSLQGKLIYDHVFENTDGGEVSFNSLKGGFYFLEIDWNRSLHIRSCFTNDFPFYSRVLLR